MNPNPYQSPNTLDSSADVVDRLQRDKLAAEIRRFLNEEATAFEFDERMFDFRDSPDSAVRFVSLAVWFYYDDCRDHLVALSKPAWDFFQRLLLLLKSDGRVQTRYSRRWSLTQLVALAALVCFCLVAISFGWGYHLLLATVPLGVISVGISWFRSKYSDADSVDPTLFPFATYSDLKSAHQAVAFKKRCCPSGIESRRIRSPIVSGFHQCLFHLLWLILSPIILLLQVFPLLGRDSRVILN